MSQHDMDFLDGNGTTVLADLNLAVKALASNSSGATEPATTYAFQPWADTANDLFKIRNAANTAWLSVFQLSTGKPVDVGYATVASATTPDIFGAAGDTINYTGTATATGFANAKYAGQRRTLICAGACSFTFGANVTSPHFASGYTYTAQAGEAVVVIATSATTFRIETYERGGVYTPTLSNTTNVAASTAFQCQWSQFGPSVTVFGKVQIDVTAASTATVLGMTIPVASNFSSDANCGGAFGGVSSNSGENGSILADITNDRATFSYVSNAVTGAATFYFSFTYQVK